MSQAKLDPRLFAFRPDLADERLRGRVEAGRFTSGERRQINWPVASVRRRPGQREPLDTEALLGETVTVFDEADGFAWVQLDRDSYVGYVPAPALTANVQQMTHRVTALATFVYPIEDIKAPPVTQLPMGARFAVTAISDRFAALSQGGFVVTRHAATVERSVKDFVDVAERFIGTPYLWGGRTRLGVDCSGLLQASLDAAGIAAPRDSDMQQTALGEELLVPDDLEGLERGDLVFWPGHVAIMADSVMIVHANAHHMAVATEPLRSAATRIEKATGSRISAIRRLPRLGV